MTQRRAASPAWREVIRSLTHHGVIPPDFTGYVALHFSGNGTPPKYEIQETDRIILDADGGPTID